MLFWHPQGSPNVPSPLFNESKARTEMLGSVVFGRVKKRIQWPLTEEHYRQALELTSNRPDWNPTAGIYFQITAIASSPERAKELCEVTAEEFAGRCVELSQEWDQAFWDLQMVRANGALEKWRFDNRPLEDKQFKERSEVLNRRLSLTIASKKMRLNRLKKGEEDPQLSEKSRRLVDRLRELQNELDSMWLAEVEDERMFDLTIERDQRKEQLQAWVRVDQAAAMNRLEAELEALQTQEVSVEELNRAMARLDELQKGVEAVARARELAMGEMSMFCILTRKPRPGTPIPVTPVRQLPSVLSGLLALVCVVARARLQDPKKMALNPSP